MMIASAVLLSGMADVALMVGVHLQDTEYRTMVVSRTGVAIQGRSLPSGLWVQTELGPRFVGVIERSERDWQENSIVVVPADQREYDLPALDDDAVATTNGGIDRTIQFLGRRYMSVDEDGGGYAQGTAHPFAYRTLNTFVLSSWPAEAVRIGTVFGENAVALFLNAARSERDGMSSSVRERYVEEPYLTSWGLQRVDGNWRVQGRLDYSAEVFRGQYHDFNVDLTMPRELVTSPPLPISWRELKAAYPGLRDAFSAPDGSFIVLLTGDRLEIMEFNGNRLGRQIRSMSAPQGKVVMAEWYSANDSMAVQSIRPSSSPVPRRRAEDSTNSSTN